MKEHLCPCGNKQTYAHCCEPMHKGASLAKNAEQLMRSRFSAFKLKNSDYLEQTVHTSQRTASEKSALIEALDSTEWLSLRILSSDYHTVEFVAFYRDAPFSQHHEKSNFRLHQGKWLYEDGDILPPIKLGRNDPCPCGSLKKIKKCNCLAI